MTRNALQTLEERGWLLFPGVVSEEQCSRFLREMTAIWERLGCPPTYAREDQRLDDGVIVSPVGMAVHGILGRWPEALGLLLPEGVKQAAREVLGGAYRLENAAGVLSDHTRPFFFWHHHLQGLLDAQDYLRLEERYPKQERIRRLSCTFYPVPLDEEHGTMLVYPRRLADPTHPPCEDMEVPWPGQHTLRCPAGSVLLMDECVWHAVTPMARAGRRAFLAGFLVEGA